MSCLINQHCYTDERSHRLFSRVSLAPVLLSQSDQLGSVPAVCLWASALELLKIGRRGGTEERSEGSAMLKQVWEKSSETWFRGGSVSSSGDAQHLWSDNHVTATQVGWGWPVPPQKKKPGFNFSANKIGKRFHCSEFLFFSASCSCWWGPTDWERISHLTPILKSNFSAVKPQSPHPPTTSTTNGGYKYAFTLLTQLHWTGGEKTPLKSEFNDFRGNFTSLKGTEFFSGQERKGALILGRLLRQGRPWQSNAGTTLPCDVSRLMLNGSRLVGGLKTSPPPTLQRQLL